MRLSYLKLSGFKSFVDPTTLHFPGDLVGIVGPNGCGKSNVIDAVRWVLGESKASELRGESMQDVIFSGSIARKASGRASVELVFENNQGRITGPWAQYGEIAVKRILTRDGQSTYWINNQAVRRKDVYDLFMGTGLGPRAYAIIGQGMISRVIESRPEELRVFLEEAAGVSRYRERRKETEGRLSDARENLSRIQDIQIELEGQLEKLQHQAEAAQKHTELTTRRDEKQRWLWFTRRQEAAEGIDRLTAKKQEIALKIEEKTAALRSIERSLEESRQNYHQATDAVHDAQTALFETNTEIARIEAEQRRLSENRDRAVLMKEHALGSIDAETRTIADAEAQRIVDAEAATLKDLHRADLVAKAASLTEAIVPLEKALASRNESFVAAQADLATAQAELRALQDRQHDLEQRQRSLAARIAAIDAERQSIERVDPTAKNLMAQNREEALAMAATAQGKLAEAEQDIDRAERLREDALKAARESHEAMTHVQAQLEALQSLQAQIDAKDELTPWLSRQGLGEKPRLWDRIRVTDRWRVAVEAVLADRLGAVELDAVGQAERFANNLPPARLAVFAAGHSGTGTPDPSSLAAQVQGEDAVSAVVRSWLMDTRCSDSLSEALRAQEQQGSGQSWVTAEGHIVSNGLVRFYAPENIQAGVLERRGKIEQLGLQERAQKLVVEESENSLKRAEAALDQRRQLLNQLRDQARSAQVRAHELEVAELRLDEKIQRLESKDSALGASLDGLRAELAATESQLLQTASTRELAQQRLTDQQNESEQQRQALESQQTELQQARAELQEVERAVQEALMAIRLSQEQQRAFEERLAQARQRLSEAQSRLAQAETQLKDIQVALDSSALQPLLDQRLSREAAVAEIRERADQLSQAMRQLDEQRVMVEREVAPLRDHLTQIEIDASGLRTSLLQVDEQMTDAQVLLADVAAGIEAAFPDGRYPKPSSLHSEVQRISREIDAMGPVNLAALSELEQATERKQFLDAQSADLNSAVETLEDAIRKIDRETRSLLQDTFDTVNKNFGELFPKLFGGGEAKLVMTGEEILDCGVQVMAQPPGKRNTSIHLLSGGEKALTATALVFALFQLNPAPFCLLDEVDAPLDDPNTERFCNLVRHMSSSTQFIFITHNKIAMEMAQHLMGVTMQEQGVSRVVAVDLDAANSIAQEIA